MSAASREALAAAARYREAIAANEDLVRRQRAELASSRQLNASYEGRIRSLESCLAASTMAGSAQSLQQPAAELAVHDPALQERAASAAPGSDDAPGESALEAAPSLAGPMEEQTVQSGAGLGQSEGEAAATGTGTEFKGFGSSPASDQGHRAEASSLPGAMADRACMVICILSEGS